MPIFEYECNHCHKNFEKLVFKNDEEDISCPECKSTDIRKMMSAVSFMGTSIGTCASGAPRGFS